MLIVDDCQKDIKNTLRKSFQQLRKFITPPDFGLGQLVHVHDDMYFGNSKDSIGLQLADLSSYFIAKHLEGDTTTEGF
jgi:Protein of unknown function (DUF3800)